jgi:cytochrome c biogenesis protein
MKLAIVLILYLAITSALSTLIPQNEELSLYYSNYSPVLARIIETTNFYRFFRSVPFLFPIVVFFLNLLTCTVDRMVRRLRSSAKKRFGPDMIHLGLLLLLFAGITGIYGRNESMIWLSEGESAQLPNGYELYLESFTFLKYEDGRPKDWLSSVNVLYSGEMVKSHIIEVNKPLKIDGLSVFQNSYTQDFTADVSDLNGETVTIRPGDYYVARDSIVVFRGIEVDPEIEEATKTNGCCPESGWAVFEELSGQAEGESHTVQAVYRVGVNEQIDWFTVEKLCVNNATGLQVVEDPSVASLIVSLILIGSGMSLTFIQKMGDKKI